ncbi:MAG: hypothetical protein JSS74_06185, partial [Actinobacteria bacterium]|nr:hypothetical protein [Actinomycetota bacterium]
MSELTMDATATIAPERDEVRIPTARPSRAGADRSASAERAARVPGRLTEPDLVRAELAARDFLSALGVPLDA